MPKFGVKCFDHAIWIEEKDTTIEAKNELAAAEMVCGEPLVEDGSADRLRAQVWPVDSPGVKNLGADPANTI